jgi:hypothetical protein
VPLLSATADAADAVTLDTWHQALSSALVADIPHDLFGFWLYPAGGEPVLLGPPELAADRLAVPAPPAVSREQIALLEEIVRDAGYRSTIAMVASYEGTDVGLLLFGALAEGVHGVRERVSAQLAADAVGPSLARLARRWRGDGSAPALPEAAELAETAALLADVCANAPSPRELARGVSQVLRPLVPHHRIELLVPGSSAEQWYRLGEHPGGPLWGDPDLVIHAGGELSRFSVPDGDPLLLAGMPGEPGLLPELNGGVPTRSAVGVRLAMSGRTVGALLLATTEERRYSEDDALLLSRLGPILAPRVDGFVMAGHLQVLRSHVAMQRSAPSRIARVLESLATVSDAAEATRRAQSEAAGLIMFDEMWFALTLGDPTRVAMFAPGERRALPDLPQTAAGDTPLGRVLRGDVPRALTDADDRTELIVPLRVAGRIVGAMLLIANQEGMFGGSDEETARQIADALAPHLELMRRDAVAPPFIPGWKRAPRL